MQSSLAKYDIGTRYGRRMEVPPFLSMGPFRSEANHVGGTTLQKIIDYFNNHRIDGHFIKHPKKTSGSEEKASLIMEK